MKKNGEVVLGLSDVRKSMRAILSSRNDDIYILPILMSIFCRLIMLIEFDGK